MPQATPNVIRSRCRGASSIWGVVALVVLAPTAAAQSITARTSSMEVEVGDVIAVMVEVTNPHTATTPQPDKTDDFEIQLDQSVQNPTSAQMYQNINGVESRRITYTYTFQAKALRVGRLTVPSFKVQDGGRELRSEPIRLSGKRPSGTPDLVCRVFRRDNENEKVYVGQRIELTLEIQVRKFRQGSFELDVNSAWSLLDRNRTTLGVFANDRNPRWGETSRQDAQGRPVKYWVYDLDATFYPSKPGPIDLGQIQVVYRYPVQLSTDVFGRMMMEQERQIQQQPTLPEWTVVPLPLEGRPPEFNGAVGVYSITATAKPADVTVGDPVTLTMFIRGNGPLDRLSAPKLDQVPELTKNFEVSGESPAGDMEGGTKVFSQTIRPLREDVTEIPPVPISYFNTKTEKYERSLSEPIPIKVRAGQRLALANPTGGGATPQNVLAPLTESSEGLIANETNAAKVLTSQVAGASPATWGMLAGAPLVYAAAWIGKRRGDRFRKDDTFRRRANACRNAKSALAGARGAAGPIRAALAGYIADRCGAPAGGLTRLEVRRLLADKNISANLVQEVDSLLDQLEGAEYGGGGEVSEGAFAAAGRLIDQLEAARLQ